MIFANLSGGRDSSAMVVASLENGIDIDYIIFCDTGFEFKEMYEYVDKLDLYLQRNFNKKITRIDSSDKILYWAFEKPIIKGEYIGRLRGIPKTIGKEYCTRESKVNPTSKFVKSISPNKFRNEVLIGYTYNEVQRGRVSNLDYGISRYPLHELKMNEPEVDLFLKQRGIMNPLYKHFERTGCFLCPKQSKRSYFNLYKHFKEHWEYMKLLEAKAKELNCVNTTFRIDKTLEQLEKEFKEIDCDELFELDYKESETCFCLK